MFLALLLLCLSVSGSSLEDPVVTIKNGKIKGLVSTTPRKNVTFHAFLGIPFAAPPVGNLRFQPPQPVEDWEGTFDATSNEKICYQADLEDPNETEDCLYLNVYTPALPGSDTKLPVLVFIYGGTFVHGHATYGYSKPQFVLEQGVIVVTINYRVGPFGFLSTGDELIPGNMGLKDQRSSFHWIQDNIEAFGGDATKVTIMGQSAGGASVTYHLLSSESEGLFRGAISNSASALCTWAYQRHPVETAYGIAQEIDPEFSSDSTMEELVEFLMSADGKAIDDTGDKYSVFAPVIEVEHDGAMFTQSMYELVKQGLVYKVPLLIGINSEEEVRRADNLTAWTISNSGFDRNSSRLVDEDLYITDPSLVQEAAGEIKAIYTSGLFEDNLAAGIQWYSDNRFTRATIKFAELYSQVSKVFFYQFSYHGEIGANSIDFDALGDVGKVAHAEDQRYFWAYYDSIEGFPEQDITTLDRYVALLTNFAKTLNPVPEADDLLGNVTWPVVTKDHFYYLDIDTDLNVKENPKEFSYEKWVQIFEKYATKPFISF